jgi:hypothetical protein
MDREQRPILIAAAWGLEASLDGTKVQSEEEGEKK